MDFVSLVAILATIVLGTYFQTVTGFGLGIIVIGICVSFNLTSLSIIAAVVSIVTFFNCFVALAGKPFFAEGKIVIALVVGAIPGVAVGVFLLGALNESSASALRGLLGAMVMFAGLSFIFKPSTLEHRSAPASFLATGFGSGLAGGLFGMAGPPVVFHLYRQPFTIELVRSILLLVFACTSVSRTVYVYVSGELESQILILSAVAIPLVALVTGLARRYPPRVSSQTLRSIVFSVLMLIGAQLFLSALWDVATLFI